MSDLISRSALIEFVKEELKQDRPYDFKIKNIQRFIEDMPTAYDISKVVAELKDLQCVNPFLTTTEYEHKAIEIARKGGVE